MDIEKHYNFEDLYKSQTMLDEHFLVNEAGFDLEELQPREKTVIFKNYYLAIRRMINKLHYCKFTQEGIEHKLNTQDKKFIFLMAQSRLLFIDRSLGINALTSDNEEVYKEVVELLDMLGFVNNGTLFK